MSRIHHSILHRDDTAAILCDPRQCSASIDDEFYWIIKTDTDNSDHNKERCQTESNSGEIRQVFHASNRHDKFTTYSLM